jgi:hypothetical protein
MTPKTAYPFFLLLPLCSSLLQPLFLVPSDCMCMDPSATCWTGWIGPVDDCVPTSAASQMGSPVTWTPLTAWSRARVPGMQAFRPPAPPPVRQLVFIPRSLPVSRRESPIVMICEIKGKLGCSICTRSITFQNSLLMRTALPNLVQTFPQDSLEFSVLIE